MDHVLRLRDSVMWYLSPAAKRRRTIMPSTPNRKSSVIERPVRPGTEPRNRKARAVLAGRVSKKYLSPSDTKRALPATAALSSHLAKRASHDGSFNGSEDDKDATLEEEEDDVTEDGESEVKMKAKIRQSREEDVDYDDDEGGSEDEEASVDGDLKVTEYLRNQREAALLEAALKEIEDEQDWHDGEKALLRKLKMRGHEPLLPSHWNRDFRTCPGILFSRNPEEMFINSRSGKEFRATTALSSLVTLGSRVRDLKQCNLPQEKAIKKEIENYLKWAERDGGISCKTFIPILSITAGKPSQPLSALSAAAAAQLNFLADRHRQYSTVHSPPLLYGIIITRCLIVFITMDSAKPNAELRTIAHFDFSDQDMDVWNGFAVAILICTVRNYLMDRRDEMESEAEVALVDPDL